MDFIAFSPFSVVVVRIERHGSFHAFHLFVEGIDAIRLLIPDYISGLGRAGAPGAYGVAVFGG
tara:strand:- start:225 stop:413 length:189 start_codon:yes stop_codon:yes gene_type:complete